MVWAGWLYSQEWWRQELWRTTSPAGTTFEQALEGYRKRCDLLVTDVAMPQIDGIELAARLRRTHPHLPVVFTSGHVGDESLRSGLLGPESAFLLKPFPPDALIASVRSLLDKARVR